MLKSVFIWLALLLGCAQAQTTQTPYQDYVQQVLGVTVATTPLIGSETFECVQGGVLRQCQTGGPFTSLISGGFTIQGVAGCLTFANGSIISKVCQDTSGNLILQPYGTGTSSGAVSITPYSGAYNGTFQAQILNLATGASVQAALELATGTANSYCNLYILDNSGAPVSSYSCGSAITSFVLQVNGLNALSADKYGHVKVGAGTAPTISSNCGGTGASISGSDNAHQITWGTTAQSTCTVNFGSHSFTAMPVCNVTVTSANAYGNIQAGTSSYTVNLNANIIGGAPVGLDVICLGN